MSRGVVDTHSAGLARSSVINLGSTLSHATRFFHIFKYRKRKKLFQLVDNCIAYSVYSPHMGVETDR